MQKGRAKCNFARLFVLACYRDARWRDLPRKIHPGPTFWNPDKIPPKYRYIGDLSGPIRANRFSLRKKKTSSLQIDLPKKWDSGEDWTRITRISMRIGEKKRFARIWPSASKIGNFFLRIDSRESAKRWCANRRPSKLGTLFVEGPGQTRAQREFYRVGAFSESRSRTAKLLMWTLLGNARLFIIRPALSGGMDWWRMEWPFSRLRKIFFRGRNFLENP